jgi:hypothetical protein
MFLLFIEEEVVVVYNNSLFFNDNLGISWQCFACGHKLDLGYFILQLTMVV